MELPLLLAGPILRRSEPKRVCVWLATSQEVALEGAIYVSKHTQSNAGGALTKDDLERVGTSQIEGDRPETVKLGDHLFVTLLAIKPTDEDFPLDTLLFYDVTINGKSLCDLEDRKNLVYPGMPLPSFFLPTQISTLLHGSCRKPHGRGQDTLAEADKLVGETAGNLQERPALLFLTGDQIYADDVAGALLVHLSSFGRKILGWQETIPKLGDPSQIELYGRKDALERAESGFTSGRSENHLLTFGEYAAMYLSVWSEQSWPSNLPKNNPQVSEEYEEKYEEEWERLQRLDKALKDVRRLLANIPTYMMFDDHEVTDDWNLHRQWYNRVRRNVCGRRIVANALAAYWAFQGWGNSPEAFSSRFINTVSKHLLDKGSDEKTAKRFDQRLWSFYRWGYSLPSNPPVIAFDSRTQREYDTLKGPARLINLAGMEWIRTAWIDVGEPADQGLILIAATPVYGFEPIEWMQKIYAGVTGSPSKVDRESWISNREGFGTLMRLLNCEIKPGRCIILSGDVHYAFSTAAEFHSDGRKLIVKQLTSSAIKNEPTPGKHLERFSKYTDRTERRVGWLPGESVPLYKRMTRPVLEFLVRWNLKKSKSKKNSFWSDEVLGITPKGRSALLYTETNLGLVHLREDGSVTHELLTAPPEAVTYEL